jgi:hypothetical protein
MNGMNLNTALFPAAEWQQGNNVPTNLRRNSNKAIIWYGGIYDHAVTLLFWPAQN